MVELSIILIRSSHIDKEYYDALTQAGHQVAIIDDSKFILQAANFNASSIIIVDNNASLLEECLQQVKTLLIDSVLLVDPDFNMSNVDLLNLGPVLILPKPKNKKDIVDYLHRYAKFRKTLIAKDNNFCQKTKVINMAVGILMINNRLNSEDAYNKLRTIARNKRHKIEKTSQEVILSSWCNLEYGCDFIKSFNDEKGCKQCSELCPYYKPMTRNINLVLQLEQ